MNSDKNESRTCRPELETVKNLYPGREYEVRIRCPEFTCVCPKTGQPDFATIWIEYVPGDWIVELKSLKLYLFSYRDVGVFHEHVTNQILDDFVEASQPMSCTVEGEFNTRGGISTVVTTHFKSEMPR